jgi:hypothetical protein
LYVKGVPGSCRLGKAIHAKRSSLEVVLGKMNDYADHNHLCGDCMDVYPCPLEKRHCKMEWRTSHNDHFLALQAS